MVDTKGWAVLGRMVERAWAYDPALYAPPRYRRACRYEAFIPNRLAILDVSLPGEVAGVVSDAQAEVAALNSIATPALAPLARLLLRTESIASSKVEGMQADPRALARAEARADTDEKVSSTTTEVLANIDAMQLAVELAAGAETIAPEAVARIHAELMARSPTPEAAGRWRTGQNWIGGNDYNPCGADFVPPPPEEVAGLVEDLCRFGGEETLPPLVQAAVAHAQFETIHPFDDGNGRTGRALVHVLLRRRGLAPNYVPPISVVLAAARDRYIAGLTAFRNGDVSGWVEQFSVAAARAAALARHYVADVSALQDEWRARLAAGARPRADAAAWAVIDVLPGYPVISVAVAVAATGRTRPAVNQAMTDLADAGVLVPSGAGRWNRTWEAAGLLDLMGDLDARAVG